MTIELAPDGNSSTVLAYSADAVGGPGGGCEREDDLRVAKWMAAQFFTAVDAELTGAGAAVAPAEPRPSAAAVSLTDAEAPAAPQPQVFTGRAGVPAGTSDLRILALGAVGGSVLTLLGIAVGYLLGRREFSRSDSA